jgi:hypothetical protein
VLVFKKLWQPKMLVSGELPGAAVHRERALQEGPLRRGAAALRPCRGHVSDGAACRGNRATALIGLAPAWQKRSGSVRRSYVQSGERSCARSPGQLIPPVRFLLLVCACLLYCTGMELYPQISLPLLCFAWVQIQYAAPFLAVPFVMFI